MKEKTYIQTIPQALGLGVMGQGPNKTTCIRRLPKGDRKALWSPVRAKPSPRTKAHYERKNLHTNNPPSPSGLGVMGQGPMALAGCRGGAPAGVWGRAPHRGCRGQRPRPGSRGSAPGYACCLEGQCSTTSTAPSSQSWLNSSTTPVSHSWAILGSMGICASRGME